ncbi:unnamed protein product [Dovyalis caffra]|uniref:CRAL-TRIO domain-containing protein n=1 Tax=Dovyalis caffra TaxID=77055 RepID=A0AAV1R1B7_9ROSI|nr:unnamed protein product [Dovyalis caffra]
MDKTQQEIALTQLRKSVQKLGSSTEKYGEPTLMRFLIARSMDPEKAAKMFVQWQKWRAVFVPNGSIPDSEVQDELGPRKAFLQGSSKDGYPQISYKNIDARGLITGFQLLQAYYPERLARCFILSMPWFFVSVWRMISRFLEKATLEKEIGEEVLPEEHGGRATLLAVQDVTVPPLEG